MPIYVSGSTGTNKLGNASCVKLTFTSNLGIHTGVGATKLSLPAVVSGSGTIRGQLSGSSIILQDIIHTSGLLALSASDSGKLIMMSPQTTASLPPLTTNSNIGLYYTFIMANDFSATATRISASSTGGNNGRLHGGFVSTDGGACASTSPGNEKEMLFGAGSLRGDSVVVTCVGTRWNLRGMVNTSGAITFS